MALTATPSFTILAIAILFFGFCSHPCAAQKLGTVVVKAGANPREVMHDSDIYYQPGFVKGQVFLKDGSAAAAPLNYNRLLDEMQFIDAKGDTLSLANEQNIRFIALGSDSFYFYEGFVRLLKGGAKARLAIKQSWKISDRRKQGGYNTTSSLAASVPRGYFAAGNRMQRLNSSDELVLEKAATYYFGDRNNRFLLAGKKNLMELFPKAEKQLSAFFKQHKVDFNNRAQMEQVLQLVETLD